MNTMISFVLGILSGCSILFPLINIYWKQKLNLEKRSLSSNFSKVLRLEIRQKKELEEERDRLLKKLDSEGQDYLLLQKQYDQFEQEVADKLTDFNQQVIKLENENRTFRDERKRLSLEKERLSREKEQLVHRTEQLTLKNGRLLEGTEQLTLRNKQLSLENDQLLQETEQLTVEYENLLVKKKQQEEALKKRRSQSEPTNKVSQKKIQQKNKYSRREADKKIQQILSVLLPKIDLLRDSVELMVAESHNLDPLIAKLKSIHDGDFTGSVKVKATHSEWRECHVQQMNMMRIYFQRCHSDKSRYQVLISPKKDQKSQNQDYEWLKRKSSC